MWKYKYYNLTTQISDQDDINFVQIGFKIRISPLLHRFHGLAREVADRVRVYQLVLISSIYNIYISLPYTVY